MRSTTFNSKNFILVLLETISLASFIQHGVGVDSSEESITNFLQLPLKQKNLLIKNWLRKLDGRNEKKKTSAQEKNHSVIKLLENVPSPLPWLPRLDKGPDDG
jgi:hypothetical protein